MPRQLYEAEARVTGGREAGHGRTSDGVLDIRLREPKELGGDGGGTNPEQLFAVGYAACFESAIRLAAHRMKLGPLDCEVDSRVALVETEDRRYEITVKLDARLAGLNGDMAADLVREAHTLCPYSNATRGNIEMTLSANGTPI